MSAPYEEAKKKRFGEGQPQAALAAPSPITSHKLCSPRLMPIPIPFPLQRKQCGNNAGLRDCILPKKKLHGHLPSLDTFSISPLISSPRRTVHLANSSSAQTSQLAHPPCPPQASTFFSTALYITPELRERLHFTIASSDDHDPAKATAAVRADRSRRRQRPYRYHAVQRDDKRTGTLRRKNLSGSSCPYTSAFPSAVE